MPASRLFVTLALVFVAAGSPALAQDQSVSRAAGPSCASVTYLANMGVAIEADGRRVVVDGFHHGRLERYLALEPDTREALEQGRAPYQRIDAILATHRHLDHFEPSAVAARLGADSNVVFIAARETVDTFHAQAPGWRGNRRVMIALPGQRITLPGIVITALDLPHNPTPRRTPANVGFIIEVNGCRLLHTGDAHPDEATFRTQLAGRQIDAAIVPFWYLTGESDAVVRAIAARRVIASHFGGPDVPTADRILERYPEALIFTRRGRRVEVR